MPRKTRKQKIASQKRKLQSIKQPASPPIVVFKKTPVQSEVVVNVDNRQTQLIKKDLIKTILITTVLILVELIIFNI